MTLVSKQVIYAWRLRRKESHRIRERKWCRGEEKLLLMPFAYS